ncbi:MAG: gliding motility protein GldN [Bacteroidota bacterium]
MKKQLLIFVLTCAFGMMASMQAPAQEEVIDGLYEKQHVENRRPVPYPSIREADVLWAKKVWRIIDLREKKNLPLYYPTTPMDDRFSLIDLLLEGIKNGEVTAYSADTEDEFKNTMSYDDVMSSMGAETRVEEIEQEDGTIEEREVTRGAQTREVKQVMIKEMWYFDRNYSRLDVRILGLCPIREYTDEDLEGEEGEEGGEGAGVVKEQAFWVYFPEARDLLAQHEVFNPNNDAQRRSFDDIFIKRNFGGYVVQESNVYDNRNIDSYTVGKEAVIESERVEEEIFNWEQDVWEF